MPEETKICPICKRETTDDMIQLCKDAEDWILGTIRKMHPDWVEEDGSCSRCLEFYKGLGKTELEK